MVDDEVFLTIDDTDDLHPLKLTFWAPQQHKAAFAEELLPVIIIVIIKLLEELIIIKVMPSVCYSYPSNSDMYCSKDYRLYKHWSAI